MTTNRHPREDWTSRRDQRSFLATLVSMVIYAVPWFVLQWRWPTFLHGGKEHLPPVSVTLGLGIGWFVVAVVLLAVITPAVLARTDHPELAWRWRHGAIHAAWFGLVVTSVSTGMRLPLTPSLRVIVTLALIAAEILAVRWLARRARDSAGRPARPSP